MRIRVLLLMVNAALLFAVAKPYAQYATSGWSDGH